MNFMHFSAHTLTLLLSLFDYYISILYTDNGSSDFVVIVIVVMVVSK